MGYDHAKWYKRIRSRIDMSTYLTHLTKPTDSMTALEVLIEILVQKTIRGSDASGFIVGENTAACFQDAPLYSISQNLYHEAKNKSELGDRVRYTAFGLSFHKGYVYNKGGRPCFYENKDTAVKILDPSEWWRIVSLDYSDKNNLVDWTHEREWRVKGNFEFDTKQATVILPYSHSYKEFLERVSPEILKNIAGIIVLERIL